MSKPATERTTRARTPASTLATRLRAIPSKAGTYPLTKYQRDPIGYARERLHVEDVLPHQEEILRALARGVHGDGVPRVAVRSGQKCGKTLIAVVAVLWFYECFADARVFLCAAIESQTKLVLWREVNQVLRNAKAKGSEIDGKLSASPAGGITSSDGAREIRGITGRDIESIAGLSGRQFTVIDEASHLPETKAQVFAGNALGGGLILFISNPTRNDGPFFEAFHRQKDFWATYHVDGEELAEWQEKRGKVIPFIVSKQRIEEMRLMYGEDSPFWQLRVKGNFLRNETGRAIPMYKIEEAIARHAVLGDDGPLVIGYDCAGPGAGGDEHVWIPKRGFKALAVHPRRALNEDAAVEETLSLLKVYRRDNEVPSVNVDAEGPIGSVIFAKLRSISEFRRLRDPKNNFDVFGVRASSRFVRDKQKFTRIRDELIWALGLWISEAGIPRDDKLQAELYEPVWTSLPDGRLTATPKSAIREKLGRSPDRFDALALAVHVPFAMEDVVADAASVGGRGAPDFYHELVDPVGPGGAMDPYGGHGYGRQS